VGASDRRWSEESAVHSEKRRSSRLKSLGWNAYVQITRRGVGGNGNKRVGRCGGRELEEALFLTPCFSC